MATTRDTEVQLLRAQIAALEAQLEQAPARTSDTDWIYRSLIEYVPALTYVSALDLDSTTLYISPQVEQIFGYSVTEWMEDPTRWASMLHPDDREQALFDLQRAQATDGRVISEYRVRHRDGRMVWVRDESVMIRDAAGKPAFLQGVVLDISDLRASERERLDLERRLLQAQKADSLGIMARGIAHDFNNLLMAILGNATLAQLESAPDAPVQTSLAEIRNAATQAASLTAQMLAYVGNAPFVRQRLDLNRLIQELADVFSGWAPAAVSIRYALQPGLPDIFADRVQMRQVVLNLVQNAIEAIGDAGGTVTLSTMVETAAGAVEAVVFAVCDTGSGIEAAALDRVFEPFYTTRFIGRGLGLSAVQGILHSHDGTIAVTSALGSGSTFVVRLPALPVVAAVTPASPVVTPIASW